VMFMRFGLRDHDMPLDPDVERELEAVDHALQGLRVAEDLEDLRDLTVDARADRPAVDPDFGAKLDKWAAAGFPRADRPGARGEEKSDSALAGLLERVRSVPPRRLLVATGAAATFVVAVAVGIGVSNQLGGSSGGSGEGPMALTTSAGGPSGDSVPNAQASGAGTAEAQRGATQDQEFAPAGKVRLQSRSGIAVGQVAGRAANRKVEQNVDLVLATEPQKVRDVADQVFDVVHRYNGFVVSSNVTSGRGGPTPVPLERGDTAQRGGSGSFELRIPAAKLQNALGALSDLAHVASRTDGTVDVTNQFDTAKARVQDLETLRQHLLRKLANVITTTEEDSLKQRIAIVENQLADAKKHLGNIQTRIRLVPVTVEIRGQEGVDSGGAWGIGDAFHDAGRVLTVFGGILLISAAVLAPLGLIGAVAWITARAVIRRRREDALE
jgi:uncharacterized protein DUF4349